jgi:hypothetical protein
MRRLVVVAMPCTEVVDVAGILDIFYAVNERTDRTGASDAGYAVEGVSPVGTVCASADPSGGGRCRRRRRPRWPARALHRPCVVCAAVGTVLRPDKHGLGVLGVRGDRPDGGRLG